MSASVPKRRRSILVAAGVTTFGIAVSPASSLGEAAFPGFAALASAEAGRVTVGAPGQSVERIVDGAGPMAQAVLDPTAGGSFAAFPYPGDIAVTFPGLFNAVTGQDLPASYPLYVAASHPAAPQRELKDPTGVYELAAAAEQTKSSATAGLRGQAGEQEMSLSGGSQAFASTVRDSDGVTVQSETVSEGISLAEGRLRLGLVRSRSVTRFRPGDQAPESTTELVVEGGSADGKNFAFGPQGLLIAGQPVPLPSGAALDQLNEILAPAGLAVRFSAPETLIGGATAGAMTVVFKPENPAPEAPDGYVELHLGRASSVIVLGDRGDFEIPGVGEPSDLTSTPGAGVPPSQATVPDPVPSAPPASGPGPAVPADSSSLAVAPEFPRASDAADIPAPLSADSAPAAAADPTAGPSTDPETAMAGTLEPRRLNSSEFFISTLIISGVLALVLSSLWRAKGTMRP